MCKTLIIAGLLLMSTQAFADGGAPPVVLNSWVAVPGVILPAPQERAHMFNEVTGTEGDRVWFPRGVRAEALATPPAPDEAITARVAGPAEMPAPTLAETPLSEPDMLPKTAGTLPLIELSGFSALAAAFLIGRLRRTCADS